MEPVRIPSELSQPVPRRVRRRRGHGHFIGCFSIFILPHCLVGVGVLLATIGTLFGMILVRGFGTEVPAQVVKKVVRKDKKGTPGYYATFSYTVGDNSFTKTETVDAGGFATLSEGMPVQVRVLRDFPQWCPVFGVEGSHPWRSFAGLAFFCLVWNAFVGVVAWAIFIYPLVLRNLVRRGTVAVGTVKGKEVQNSKTMSYKISYGFEAAINEDLGMESIQKRPMEGSMTIYSHRDYDCVQLNDKVIVLYDPRRPRRSLLYQLADYEAVET
jgi:hypothetical protein